MITSNSDKRRTVGKVLLDSAAAAQAFGRVAEWSEVFAKQVTLIIWPTGAGFES